MKESAKSLAFFLVFAYLLAASALPAEIGAVLVVSAFRSSGKASSPFLIRCAPCTAQVFRLRPIFSIPTQKKQQEIKHV